MRTVVVVYLSLSLFGPMLPPFMAVSQPERAANLKTDLGSERGGCGIFQQWKCFNLTPLETRGT